MKIQSPINKSNWYSFFEYKDLTVNFTNDEEPLICVFYYDEIIGYATPQELTDHIEVNYPELYKEICYTDEDGDKDIDVGVYEYMDYNQVGNAGIVVGLYLDMVNELYSTLND